jgi:hypothetical protein
MFTEEEIFEHRAPSLLDKTRKEQVADNVIEEDKLALKSFFSWEIYSNSRRSTFSELQISANRNRSLEREESAYLNQKGRSRSRNIEIYSKTLLILYQL